jgi:hypothetical protein
MTAPIRIIRHEAVPKCGSFEIRVDGRRSRYFYWEDLPGRRLRPGVLTSEEALVLAKSLARGLTIMLRQPALDRRR